jgi:two-component system sensor histidine kinase PilS (NtrC family)
MANNIINNKHSDTSWQALEYFNLYRFLIAFLSVTLIWADQVPEPLGVLDPFLFSITSHIYILVSICFEFFIKLKKPRYNLQVAIHVLLDIIIISVLMYASDGLKSGFGMLLVIAVAGGSILITARIAVLFAAIATIMVLIQEIYVELILNSTTPNYIHAGFLGITFFATAILGNALARRIRETEALAQRHAVDLKSMARLNELIVQRIQSGIIVLDNENRIRLLNESACLFLGIEQKNYSDRIDYIAPHLAEKLYEWMHHGGERSVILKPEKGDVDVQISFTRFKPDIRFGILIFIEDIASMRQSAQHMKLASLGRLAASIAHEVRNPLGAISHASQLLSESSSGMSENDRLIQIIMQHSRRMNAIIENVQQISRREPATPENIEINLWLNNFMQEFVNQKQLSPDAVVYDNEIVGIYIRMDPSQLHQVMLNLCENAIRYSNGVPLFEIKCGIRKETERPFLDVVDHGPGITEDVVEHLFEPFFTTDSKGSGLGLYIARELCEANQASLSLDSNSSNGCCFRIHFSPADRQQNLVQ